MAPIKFGVGQSVLRKEDDALIRGKGRYTDDHAPATLHALVLRSPHAHAKFTINAGRAHALPLRPSLTSGEASSILHLSEFDALAHSFDEVVYGRRPAEPRDVEAARESWPHVLESAKLR